MERQHRNLKKHKGVVETRGNLGSNPGVSAFRFALVAANYR